MSLRLTRIKTNNLFLYRN